MFLLILSYWNFESIFTNHMLSSSTSKSLSNGGSWLLWVFNGKNLSALLVPVDEMAFEEEAYFLGFKQRQLKPLTPPTPAVTTEPAESRVHNNFKILVDPRMRSSLARLKRCLKNNEGKRNHNCGDKAKAYNARCLDPPPLNNNRGRVTQSIRGTQHQPLTSAQGVFPF
jgi:hypothetical protein